MCVCKCAIWVVFRGNFTNATVAIHFASAESFSDELLLENNACVNCVKYLVRRVCKTVCTRVLLTSKLFPQCFADSISVRKSGIYCASADADMSKSAGWKMK